MFTKRYSESEMDQWHTACTSASSQAPDATRHTAAHTATAKGQGERNSAYKDARAMSAMQSQMPDDWASECLFDCYNG